MVYISLLIIFIYILYVLLKNGVPHSLSATFYKTNWIFSAVLTLCTSLILPEMLKITPENYLFLAFLSCASIVFVAFAPDFRSDDLTDKVHTISAITGLILSQLWISLIDLIHLLWWIPIIIYIIYYLYKYKSIEKLLDDTPIKFWTEVFMLITIYSKLLL